MAGFLRRHAHRRLFHPRRDAHRRARRRVGRGRAGLGQHPEPREGRRRAAARGAGDAGGAADHRREPGAQGDHGPHHDLCARLGAGRHVVSAHGQRPLRHGLACQPGRVPVRRRAVGVSAAPRRLGRHGRQAGHDLAGHVRARRGAGRVGPVAADGLCCVCRALHSHGVHRQLLLGALHRSRAVVGAGRFAGGRVLADRRPDGAGHALGLAVVARSRKCWGWRAGSRSRACCSCWAASSVTRCQGVPRGPKRATGHAIRRRARDCRPRCTARGLRRGGAGRALGGGRRRLPR